MVSVAMPNKNPTVKELLGEGYREGEQNHGTMPVGHAKFMGTVDIYAMVDIS